MKLNKKIFLFIITLFLMSFMISCNEQDISKEKEENNEDTPLDDEIEEVINEITIVNNETSFFVGQTFTLKSYIGSNPVYYVSSDNEIVSIQSTWGKTLSVGAVVITAYNRYDDSYVDDFLVSVKNNAPTSIELSGSTNYKVGDIVSFYYTITPSNALTDVIWETSDESIVKVNDGIMIAVGSGIVTIKVISKYDENIFDEVTIWIKDNEEYTNDTIINKNKTQVEQVDLSSLQGVLKPLITKGNSFIIGVNGYSTSRGTETQSTSGTGTIYKRYCVLSDGTEVLDDGSVKDFSSYKYYVITCKHLINKVNKVTVYYDNVEKDAEIIAYDEKIDLGVITFYDTKYYPIAVFADSDSVSTGEFVLAIGNTYGVEYENSASFGVVSYNGRYVATDTDGDETNDWDALYIQHDAPVGEGNSGGPLINMKGEVVGINSEMISADSIDNMAFAIPSNLVLELCSQLAQGIVPSRPLLKISVLSVKDIISSNYLLDYYPIPEGITYGMFVAEVDTGGVGEKAGMKPGDIIVEFNGLKIAYSYELRAALGGVIIGSNEEISIIVYRDGEYVTLKAVF